MIMKTMALPDKKSDLPSTPKGRSYSDVAKRTVITKTSLMNLAATDSSTNGYLISDNTQPDTTIRSTIWRHARVSNGFFLDISKIPNVTEQQHLEYLADQHGGARNFNGIKFIGKNKERYLEVYPVPDIITSFTTQGVYYENPRLRLLPCKALEGEGEVVQLNLSELPPLGEDRITSELSEVLTKFGNIMDFGLKYESSRGFFTGLGYAVIQRPKANSFNKLEHIIYFNGGKEFCYATFPDIPVWCRYCHSEDHTKYECAKSKARILCYSCDKYGHISKECPSPARSKKNGTKPFKKQRKINRASEQVEDIDSQSTAQLPPSHELLKSQWAPPKSPTILYNGTQTQAIVEDQSFFSSNPFEALLCSGKVIKGSNKTKEYFLRLNFI
jgi:hypothetical protein